MATFTVNGQSVTVEKNQKLIRYLRDTLHLTSVKDGCSEGACGTCHVLIDGKPTKACIPQTDRLEGRTVLTVEGLSDWEKQVYTFAFGEAGAVQCGFCIPGMVISAKALLDACGYTAAEIGTDKLAGLPGVVRAKGAGSLCEALGVGEPTLNDIVAELCKPGRDVRDSLPKPLLRSDVMGLDDLKPGMELTGTVRNVIDFGAFVDLGVHQDGLVHVSQISDKFIKHPREVLKVGDIVRVKVLNVDTAKKRIALTMKGVPQQN